MGTRERTLSLLALIALLVAVAAAYRRTGRERALLERIVRLEDEMRALRARAGGDAGAEGAGTPGGPPPLESIAAAPESIAAGSTDAPAAPRAATGTSAPPPGGPPAPGDAPAPPVELPIDWERWIGVRGAAVLGGGVLALAGLYFFSYALEHALFPPWLRVVVGTLAGSACLAVAELTLRREYGGTANALAGAGVVILYAAFWAAANRYALVGPGALFVLLAAVTGAAGALSWRHQSLVVAVLGLVGGFLTPLFASSGADRPLGLFAYLLLLDVAVLWLAHRRGWPLLALLALVGTAAWQVFWMGLRMGPERLWLGLLVVAAFAAVFALSGRRGATSPARQWLLAQAGGVLLPFVFAIWFAANGDLRAGLVPVAMLLALLSAAAAWLAHEHRQPLVAVAAASAAVAVLAAWVMQHEVTTAIALRLGIASIVLAAIFHAVVERAPASSFRDGPSAAAVVVAAGLFALLVVTAAAAPRQVPPWPWLPGWAGLAALLLRHGGVPGRERLQAVAALACALALGAVRAAHEGTAAFPPTGGFLALVVATAVTFQLAALVRAPGAARRAGEHAAALVAVALLVLAIAPMADAGLPVQAATAALGLLAMLAGTRLGGGGWLALATVATAAVHTLQAGALHAGAGAALGLQTGCALAFTAWPFVCGDALRADRWAWRASALASPAWFPALGRLFVERFGDAAIGVLPLALGTLTLAAARRAQALFAGDDEARTRLLAWFLGVTTAFVTVAIPLQLEREWITIGWALEGAALVVLWQRLEHPGLKYVGVALLAAATFRLIANGAVLDYYPRPAWRLVNWLAYAYLVPATALFVASARLAPLELPRLRAWERPWYAANQPLGAVVTGLAGLAVVFVWLNLAVVDWFSAGATLDLAFERLPARDLAISIVWAAYALVLLALGVRRASVGLRWLSLGLMMVTILKVFLHDLGELQDLYRVASLLGLALSLLAVSVAYQRFVARDSRLRE